MVLATFFGTGWRADAFFLALRIPNLFRDLVGEGAANSAVVPVLSEYQIKKDPQNFWKLVNAIALWALIILSAITLAGMLLSPVIVRLMAPGFAADPEKLRLAVDLTRIMFPYLILIGLTAHSMAVLATFRSFGAPAFSPCLFNIAVIAAALLSTRLPEPTYGLAIGVLVGGMAQLGAQVPAMFKQGMRFGAAPLAHPGAKECGKLLTPRLVGSGVYQINLLIDTFCASLSHIVGAGGISAIYYANRLIQLPLAVFGFSMTAAALPALSKMAAQNEMNQFKRTVVFSLENIFFIMFPSSILMIILSEPVVRVLFQRGQFDAYSTGITSFALVFYSLGLFSFGGSKILTTSFYALKDTSTPVKVAAGCLVLNAVLNFVLMGPLKIGGIALASSIASATGYFVLFYLIERKIGDLGSGLKRFVLKVGGASLLAGLAVRILENSWAGGPLGEWGKLFLSGIIGITVYAVACLLLKVPQMEKIVKSLRFKV